MRDFFLGPDHIGETALAAGEFLLAIEVPDQSRDARQVFLKHRIRHAADFALVSVATVALMSDGVCKEISIVLGGIAPFPYVAKTAEAVIRGRALTEPTISEAAEAAVAGVRPLPMNHYKVDLTKAMVRRALRPLLE